MSLFTPERLRAGVWIGLGIAVLVLMYVLAPVLTPFAAAFVLAYLLVLGVDWLERRRVPSWLALAVAVPVKLARVACLAGVVAGYGLALRRTAPADTQPTRRPALVPGFVLGFLAMVVLGSLIQLPAPVLAVAKIIQTAALAMAMAALGLGMQLRGLRNVGWRPLLLGLVATLIVSMVALTGVLLIG